VLGTLCVIDDKPRAAADFDAEALAEFADVLSSTLWASDLVAALLVGSAAGGGAEPDRTGRRQAVRTRRRGGAAVEAFVGLGVTESPRDEEVELWDLVAAADAQMFEVKWAKKAGLG
jgi:hypothetical protein